MEEANLESDVRTRLILAGLAEMEEHGERDFSLRRVATRAQVSCAAPYRHFRDKEELIGGVFSYILGKWELLCREIENAYHDDLARRLLELSVSYLRFWLSNPKGRSVLLSRAAGSRRAAFDAPLCRSAEELALSRGGEAAEVRRLTFSVLSTVYGAIMLLPPTERETDEIVADARKQLKYIIKSK